MDIVPERWWQSHEEEIFLISCMILSKEIDKIADSLKWMCALNTDKEIFEMLSTMDPEIDMSPEKKAEGLISLSEVLASVGTFKEYYGHLCSMNEAGEPILPLSALLGASDGTSKETRTAIGVLRKEHPEWVFFEEIVPNNLIQKET